ncbi:MAG TPA: transcriptional regulator [Woeseiaceae bacterium]|nr:transcriptional regulator [Woeseiaceae bacterium]
MQPETKKLLTIVTEAIIEASLTADLKRLGAGGYTIVDARGSGTRGIRDAGWASSGNIRVEVVCEPAAAERIADHLRENYYRDYAMILYLSDVAVLRPEKF